MIWRNSTPEGLDMSCSIISRISYALFHSPKEVVSYTLDFQDLIRPIPFFLHPQELSHLSSTFLLFVLNQLNIILRNLLILLQQELLNLIANITLHDNLLAPTRQLRHRTPGRKFLAEILCDFLQLETEGFEARDGRHILAFVALYSFDVYHRAGYLVGLFGFGGFGFGGFLLGVFGGSFLGVD